MKTRISGSSSRARKRYSDNPELYTVKFDPKRHLTVMEAIAEHRRQTGYMGAAVVLA